MIRCRKSDERKEMVMYTMVVDLPGLKIGDSVFVVVTPKTNHIFLEHFRPKPYFVLETQVTDIDVRGGRAYRFCTRFAVLPGSVFTDAEAAKAELVRRFAKETDGLLDIKKVTVVSAREEADGNHVIDLEISKSIASPYGPK